MSPYYYWTGNKLMEVQSPGYTYFTWEPHFTRCVDRADSFRASFQSGTINRSIEQLRVYTARKYTLLNPLIVFARFDRKKLRPVYSDLRRRVRVKKFTLHYWAFYFLDKLFHERKRKRQLKQRSFDSRTSFILFLQKLQNILEISFGFWTHLTIEINFLFTHCTCCTHCSSTF